MLVPALQLTAFEDIWSPRINAEALFDFKRPDMRREYTGSQGTWLLQAPSTATDGTRFCGVCCYIRRHGTLYQTKGESNKLIESNPFKH